MDRDVGTLLLSSLVSKPFPEFGKKYSNISRKKKKKKNDMINLFLLWPVAALTMAGPHCRGE